MTPLFSERKKITSEVHGRPLSSRPTVPCSPYISPGPRRASLGKFAASGLALLCGLFLPACTSTDRDHVLIVSVPDQKLVLLRKGEPVAAYPISTSKFGLGDAPGSCATPTGKLQVAHKIGKGAPPGAVFKDRKPTGEVLPVDAPGRDPIVTRILWLRGLEAENRNAFGRYIYIHGTPEERNVGRPVSFGCIRMRTRDVISLFDQVGVGARVEISEAPFGKVLRDPASGG